MTGSFPTYELAEWQTQTLPDVTLTARDRQLVDSLMGGDAGRLDIDELRDGIRVRSASWVGVVRFQNFEVRITPKLAGENAGLVEMLTLTGGLDALRRKPSRRRLKVEESIHLLDLIALLFAEACERVVEKGLLHDYVEQEADLQVLRGRLLVGQQVRRYYGRVDRLACRYDDHLTDVVENQILAVALGVIRSRVSNPDVRLQIHRLHTVFAGACSAEKLVDLQDVRAGMTYHRMNEYYREAHELAWLLLDSMGINDLLAVGKTRSFAFLLDMNQLFEKFVTRLVNHALRQKDYLIHIKRRDRAVIWDPIRNRPYTHIEPDILIESSNGNCLTLDAKYKLYDEKGLSTADIYQSIFYAYSYNETAARKPATLLLYPSSRQQKRTGYLQTRGWDGRVKAHLQSLSVPIPEAAVEIGENNMGSVSGMILEAVEQSLT